MPVALVLLLSTFILPHGAAALSEPALREYVHTAWTQHDGIPLSAVQRITQTNDGYLWITTSEEGLLRFDGVRFVNVPSPCGREGLVTNTASDRAGGMWLVCAYRIYHRNAAGRTTLVKQSRLPAELRPSMPLFVDHLGRLWLWGRRLSYLRSDETEGPTIPGTDRPAGATSCHFAEDTEGTLWFGTAQRLLRIRDDHAEVALSDDVGPMTRANSGGIYVTNRQSLLHIQGTSITTVAALGPKWLANSRELVEGAGGIWVGTSVAGIGLVRHGHIELFGTEQGLSSNSVLTLMKDREGTIWVGTPLGLHRFREPMARMMTKADGLPEGMPQFVFVDSGDRLWVGTSTKLVRIDGDGGVTFTSTERFIGIGEDRAGRIWLATMEQLGYLQDGRFTPVRNDNGTSITGVFALRRDDQGNLWALSRELGVYRLDGVRARIEVPEQSLAVELLVSSRHGIWASFNRDGRLLRKWNGQLTTFDTPFGPDRASVHAIYEDGESVWIGAGSGLSRWRDGKWTSWTTAHGLPGRGDIYEITSDSQGRFWLMSDGGILLLSRAQLDRTPDGQPRRLSYLRIGSLDRVMPHRGGMGTSPRVARRRDGRLYFATYDSVAVVDTEHLRESSFRPPIVLETVLINRRSLVAGATPRFVKPEDVQFEYTSLSLRNAENVRFRYILEGYDRDWVDAGTQRRASYRDLKPGQYRFRVIGSGSEGVWNETGADYSFQIAAPYYQTPMFLLAALGAIGCGAWLLHRYRVQLAAGRIRLRMEAQNEERLRIAQDMHDTLLQGMQGSAMIVHAALEKLEREPSEARVLLDRALAMVRQSTLEARDMLSSLRMAGAKGPSLPRRLESMAMQEAALYQQAPQVVVQSDGAPRDLRPQVAEDLYLVASEAIKNALRHARANQVKVTIRYAPAQFQMMVTDDGNGIDPEIQTQGRTGHFGLRGMRERTERHSGVFTLESSAGGGTSISLVLEGSRAYRHPLTG